MKIAVATIGIGLCAAVAAAQGTGDLQTTKRGPGGDPNEVVCVKEAQLGSRLAHRRVCRTRAEWEAHHQQARLAIEKAQLDKQTGNQ